MLANLISISTYALALALASAVLLLGVPRLLFSLEPRLRCWLARVERWLESDDSHGQPRGPGSSGSTLWPRISGPA